MQGKQEVLERIDMLVDIYGELANDAVIDTDNLFCDASSTLNGCKDDLLDLKQLVERITDDPDDI